MGRISGTVVRGLRAPIVKEGDDLKEIVLKVILGARNAGEFEVGDRDIIAITESIVARAAGNYATVDQIAADVKRKVNKDKIGIIFPILSRNRFAVCLKGIARGATEVVLMLSYPGDEVGNHLIGLDILDENGINPYSDVFTGEEFEKLFGKTQHRFTGIDYINYYREIIEENGAKATILLANDPREILKHTDTVITCDIHTRNRTKRLLKGAGAAKVLGLDDIMTSSVDDSGYNEKYGLLGSNKATEEMVKLFPRDCTEMVKAISRAVFDATGKKVEVMVYGDGAFKDPVGGIWELADPVVSPGFTPGLEGKPGEVKLKYLADNEFADLKGAELQDAISEYIRNKKEEDTLGAASQGTTPRRLTDLIGSLADLTSGSGDKGTPIVYIQGYFDNYTD